MRLPLTKDVTSFVQRMSVPMLAANAIGGCVFVACASTAWAVPDEPVAGADLVWFAAILPVISLFSLLNLAWIILILSQRQWRGFRYFSFAIMLWLIAIVVDGVHH